MNFVKNSANESPLRGKFMAKIRNVEFWGLYSHISAPINVKFGTGVLPRAKFHGYLGSVWPLRGEKPIFGPLSKNNTGMAALRAGLPVIIGH